MHDYHLHYLSESALLADFGNRIDETTSRKVIAIAENVRNHGYPEVLDVIPGYASVMIQFHLFLLQHRFSRYADAYAWMESVMNEAAATSGDDIPGSHRVHRIPVCYEEPYCKDLAALSDRLKVMPEEIISLHCARRYRVYMLGFLPGFPYMASVDERIVCGRKPQPVPTIAGSVGIAGQQTGIYPFDSPGGWHIIGRTPETVFDRSRGEPCLFSPGDTVEFYPISAYEFKDHQSRCA